MLFRRGQSYEILWYLPKYLRKSYEIKTCMVALEHQKDEINPSFPIDSVGVKSARNHSANSSIVFKHQKTRNEFCLTRITTNWAEIFQVSKTWR